MKHRNVVSRDEWLQARQAHLVKEKEFTRMRDELTRDRQAVPWVKVDETYGFDGANGPETLSELFDGCSQLMVSHFMFHPDWEQGCKSCSFIADNYDGSSVHLRARDVAFVAVSRAPLAKLEAYKQRMGWDFKWVSSENTAFNKDYHVTFTDAEVTSGDAFYNYRNNGFPFPEAPGMSVFYKDADGTVYHTYSCYGRGLDLLIGTYNYLDLVPKGRDEQQLPYTMEWIRHHDRYGKDESDPGFQ